MNRFVWIILFCLCVTTLFAQRYKEKHIKRDLQNLEGFENAFIGFALYDPAKDKMLASHYANKHMTPASNTKLYTFWGTDNWLPETLEAFGWAQNSDSLVFWSTGYPLTLHPDHPDSTLVNFLKNIPSEKDVFYWVRPIEIERYGSGWGWDDFGGYYGAEMSLFPIYGNSVQFIIDNEHRTYTMTPNYSGFRVNISDEDSNRARVYRDEFWNEFEIHFDSTINKESPIDTLVRPFRYSDRLFSELVGQVSGHKIHLAEEFPIKNLDFIENHQMHSETGVLKDTLFKWMLQPSDNLFAESLLLMSSAAQRDTLSLEIGLEQAEVHQTMVNSPLLNEELIWVDGSGLSRYNMFKPSEMIGVLESIYDQSSEERLFELLPNGGVSGTIEDWYAGENGEPFVFAKTGTLSNNHTLSGFIKTKKGKTLIFSIMANHYTCSTNQIRENFEVMLNKIRNGY